MSKQNTTRRKMLQATGLTLVGGTLAGCGGSSDDGEDSTNDGDDGSSNGDMSPSGSGMEAPSEVSSYLSDVSNFGGSLEDMTGMSEVTVVVGSEGNDGSYAFSPAAIQISTGTTVLFEWTGEGGAHNVVAEDGTFDSGSSVSSAGVQFEYTFEETGTYNYNCVPHKALGMKGSIVVA